MWNQKSMCLEPSNVEIRNPAGHSPVVHSVGHIQTVHECCPRVFSTVYCEISMHLVARTSVSSIALSKTGWLKLIKFICTKAALILTKFAEPVTHQFIERRRKERKIRNQLPVHKSRNFLNSVPRNFHINSTMHCSISIQITKCLLKQFKIYNSCRGFYCLIKPRESPAFAFSIIHPFLLPYIDEKIYHFLLF